MSTQPVLDADLLRRSLAAAGWPDAPIEVVDQTGSTNADLLAAAKAGVPPWTVRIALEQTAGRGRFQRSWASPPGASVAISVLLSPDRPTARWPWLSLLTGIALAESFQHVGVAAQVKWPNDVLAPGGKLCGILAELVSGPSGMAVVVGFGINIALTRDDLPVPTASSLLLEGADVEPTALVADVLSRWRQIVELWQRGADVELQERYRAVSSTIGRPVKVLIDESGDTAVHGTATDVDDAGQLLVDTGEGTRAFSAGDVIHLR